MHSLSQEDRVLQLLAKAAKSDEAAGNLRGMVCLKGVPSVEWRGRACVPPGTLLDRIVSSVEQGSSIALELALMVTIHVIAAHMLVTGVYLQRGDMKVYPTIWSLILASSGAGKTFIQKTITGALELGKLEIQGLSGAVSSSALLQYLEKQPSGLWIRDEFGQYVARFDKGDMVQNELKDFLLRLFDGSPLFRRSVTQGQLKVDEPRVTLLGLSVLESWPDCVSPASMIDGFASRLSYVVADPDSRRPAKAFPEWIIDTRGWNEEWQALRASVQPFYRTTPEAVEYFRAQFTSLYDDALPEAFSRRILWSSHKLALIYHVILGNRSAEVDRVAYGWAFRLIRLQLADARRVMEEATMGELQRLLLKSETLAARFAAEGRVLTKRDLIRGVRGIQNVMMAEGIFRVLWPESAKLGRKMPSGATSIFSNTHSIHETTT